MDVTGNAAPAKVGIPIVDFGAGMYSAFAIALALLRRREKRGGPSSRIDISLLDTSVSWLLFWLTGHSYFVDVPKRMGTAHPTIAPYQLFEAKDGYVAIAASTDELWRRMCGALDLPGLLKDPRFAKNSDRVKNRLELVRVMQGRLKLDDKAALLKLLSKAGVPSAPLQTLEDIISDEQVEYRRMIGKIRHPIAGTVLVPNSPIRFSPMGRRARDTPPPTLGEQTDSIMRSLGYDRNRVNSLRRDGVLGPTPGSPNVKKKH
jgi:crotonobetainyl-CoA:carnitine CoA-transferase CaiB-like acyl-CoA transferase